MYHSDSFCALRFVCLFVFFLEGGGGGLEQLLNFCTYRVGAHSRLGAWSNQLLMNKNKSLKHIFLLS